MPETTEIAFVIPADGELPSDDRMTVRQRYGNRVVIITVPAEEVENILSGMPGELTTARRRDDIPDETWNALGDSERIALEGYWLRQSDEYQRQKEERPGQGLSWDHPDYAPPDPPGGMDFEAAPAVVGLNDRLRGSVALGLVIVSGPGDLAFSPVQVATVMAEVQGGLSWLGSQFQLTPVTFVIDTHVIPITTPSNPNAPDLEALWRDPAMAVLDYPKGYQGVTKFAETVKAVNSTDSAYVSFFTHYPLDHFAYARPSVPETVMQYENDGWGPGNIDAAEWRPGGDSYTASTPFVADGVIYFQGTNNKLYRINTDGSGGEWLGKGYAASSPFVAKRVLYFRGSNDGLWMINLT